MATRRLGAPFDALHDGCLRRRTGRSTGGRSLGPSGLSSPHPAVATPPPIRRVADLPARRIVPSSAEGRREGCAGDLSTSVRYCGTACQVKRKTQDIVVGAHWRAQDVVVCAFPRTIVVRPRSGPGHPHAWPRLSTAGCGHFHVVSTVANRTAVLFVPRFGRSCVWGTLWRIKTRSAAEVAPRDALALETAASALRSLHNVPRAQLLPGNWR